MKLCQIYNFASHYRTPIYKLIDKEFDTDFVFGNNMGDIKKMDYGSLKGNVTEVDYKTWYGISFQKGVLSLLREQYDVYLLTGETRCVSTWLFLLLAKLYPKKKVYLWTHGWYGKETWLERLLKKIFFSLPDGNFLYGYYARNLMIKEGFDADKLYVIHNSLDYDRHLIIRSRISFSDVYKKHFGNCNPVMIMIGRLNMRKNLHQLLEAVALLREKGKFYNIVLVGDGEDRQKLETMSVDLGINGQVWFYGACYDEEKNAELIYNSDMCVVPGDIGLTAIHVMTFGVPVISHNHFPCQGPEFEAIRENDTGLFFEYNNVESLAQKIDAWFLEGRDREAIRCACMREIDNCWTPHYQLNVLKSVLLKNSNHNCPVKVDK